MELTLLGAVATASALVWLGLGIWPERVAANVFDHLIAAALIGLLAGRITTMASQGVNPISNLGDFIVIRGGVHTGAAALAFLAYLLWVTRSDPEAVDSVAPAVLLGIAGWHGGCLWRGSCLGVRSELPWAWALDGSDITRHPVELYAAIGLVVGAWLVSRLGWRPWMRAGVALAIASGIRLLTEPLRPSITGGPVLWYLAGAVVGLAAAAFGARLVPVRPPAPT